MAKKKEEMQIVEITTEQFSCCILGKTPLIMNRMSEKVKQELLFPKGRKTAAEKRNSLKHNPIQEFKDAPYRIENENSPTYLAHLATAFKHAIAGAAVDIPGSTKAQIGRSLWIEGEKIPIYGIPRMFMAVTRSADMNKTPDVRTRCIVPEWAGIITLNIVTPTLKANAVTSLLAAAGLIQGIGDWRPGKGSGNYGQFQVVDQNDSKFQEIMKTGGRAAQIQAMQQAEPYDRETEELFTWYNEEIIRRS